MSYLFAAFSIVWIVIFLYVLSISRRQRELSGRLKCFVSWSASNQLIRPLRLLLQRAEIHPEQFFEMGRMTG